MRIVVGSLATSEKIVSMKRPRRRNERLNLVVNDTCSTKRRFKTEAEARDAAEFGMLRDMNIELDVYQCLTCQQWHLTRQKNTKRV